MKVQKEAMETGTYLTLFHLLNAENTPGAVKDWINLNVMNYLGAGGLTHHQEFLKSFSSSTTNLLRN